MTIFVLEGSTPQKQITIFVLERPTPQKWMTLSLLGGVTPQQASNLLMQHFSEEKKKKKKRNNPETHKILIKTVLPKRKRTFCFSQDITLFVQSDPALVRTLTIIIIVIAIIKSKPNTAATRWLNRSYPRSGPDGNWQSVGERRG